MSKTARVIPSADHALLTPEQFARVMEKVRTEPRNEVWLAARQIVATEVLALLSVSTDPALADKPERIRQLVRNL
jgi:hypothetical protein